MVAVGILDSALGTRRGRLVEGIQMGVEAAVVDEGAGGREAEGEDSRLAAVVVGPDEDDVQLRMAGGVDEVVAHHRVVVGVVVDPRHDVVDVDRLRERREAVIPRNDHLPVDVPALLSFPLTEGDGSEGENEENEKG